MSRCSDACTRSGITAVLTVAVALALLLPLETYQQALNEYEKGLQDYRQQIEYAQLRGHLSETVQFLTIDPCYRIWTNAGKVILGRLTLNEISAIDCSKTAGVADQWLEWALEGQKKSKSINGPAFRLPPEDLMESKAIAEEIKGAILKVLQAHARFRDNDIIARHGLAFETLLASKLRERHLWVPNRDQISAHELHARYGVRVMTLSENDLGLHLSVGGAIEVAGYRELTPRKEPDSPWKQNISLPQISISVDPMTAAMLIQFIFLLSLGYFLIFQKEATRVAGSIFPGMATLFSVFQRTSFSKFAFYLLCCLPPSASFLLARSIQDTARIQTLVMWVLFVLILLEGALIARTFEKHSRRTPSRSR